MRLITWWDIVHGVIFPPIFSLIIMSILKGWI